MTRTCVYPRFLPGVICQIEDQGRGYLAATIGPELKR